MTLAASKLSFIPYNKRLKPLKPKRLKKRKAVTIGIGFVCNDGILLCSDRQITSPSGFKYEECKISRASNDEFGLLFSYAGSPDAATVMFNKVWQDFSRELAKVDKTLNLIQKTCEALQPIFRNKQTKGLQTLIGIRYADGLCCMAKTFGDTVVMTRIDHIGWGDSSVLRFLDDLLLQECETIHEAEVIGSYVVSVANRYVDGCGGGPDISTIHTRGTMGDSSFVFPNQSERFAHSEIEAGKELRARLLSGGLKGKES